MRTSIDDIIDRLEVAHRVPLSPEVRRWLVRELLIVMSTPSHTYRDDRAIRGLVDEHVARAQQGEDPRAILERVLNNAWMPYAYAKVIQNLGALIHARGVAEGRATPRTAPADPGPGF